MFKPIDAMLYFYLLAGQKYITMNDDQRVIPYKPYTVCNIVTNEDMYDLDKIVEEAFIKKED